MQRLQQKSYSLAPKNVLSFTLGESMKTLLYVDGWLMKDVTNVETGTTSRQDTLTGSIEMSHMNSEKYLGQVISSDGTNSKNIEKLRNKGIGLKTKLYKCLKLCQEVNTISLLPKF